MGKRRTREQAIRGYIRLPKGIRKISDPLVKNRAIPQDFIERRSDKGKKIVKKRLKELIIGKKR